MANHIPFRSVCPFCVVGKAVSGPTWHPYIIKGDNEYTINSTPSKDAKQPVLNSALEQVRSRARLFQTTHGSAPPVLLSPPGRAAGSCCARPARHSR